MRHRQIAPRSRGRQCPGAEIPDVPQPVGQIGKKMPKKGRDKSGKLDPLSLPPQLQTALEALYGHYQKTFVLWQEARIARSAVLHRRLQQHLHVEARLRIRLRLSTARTKTARRRLIAAVWHCSAITTNTAIRSRAQTRS